MNSAPASRGLLKNLNSLTMQCPKIFDNFFGFFKKLNTNCIQSRLQGSAGTSSLPLFSSSFSSSHPEWWKNLLLEQDHVKNIVISPIWPFLSRCSFSLSSISDSLSLQLVTLALPRKRVSYILSLSYNLHLSMMKKLFHIQLSLSDGKWGQINDWRLFIPSSFSPYLIFSSLLCRDSSPMFLVYIVLKR